MINLDVREVNENYVGFSIPNSMLEFIDRLSDEKNTSRAEIIRAIIRTFQQSNAEQK